MSRAQVTLRTALRLSAAATAIAGGLPLFARAQVAWPSKSIRLIVSFDPGGSSEIVARATGGAGNVAMGEVARADDEHTIILGHIGTLAVNPFIFDKLPYDAAKAFTPVSLLSKVPSFYVVRPDLPVKNLKEFIALAKSKPGQLN